MKPVRQLFLSVPFLIFSFASPAEIVNFTIHGQAEILSFDLIGEPGEDSSPPSSRWFGDDNGGPVTVNGTFDDVLFDLAGPDEDVTIRFGETGNAAGFSFTVTVGAITFDETDEIDHFGGNGASLFFAMGYLFEGFKFFAPGFSSLGLTFTGADDLNGEWLSVSTTAVPLPPIWPIFALCALLTRSLVARTSV